MPLYGEATLELGSSTAIRIGMWHDKSTDKYGVLAGRVGRCTYMVKPPGVFPERFVRAVGEEEQVHLYGEATRMYWGTLSLVCCMANVEPISIKSNKGWQVHLYGEAARCVPEISNPRGVEGEPGRCT